MRFIKFLFCFVVTILFNQFQPVQGQQKPVRIAVAGMTHGHVGGILGRKDSGDIELVGFAEPNEDLAKRLIAQYHLNPDLWYADLDEMLETVKPEAVCAFGSIFEHLDVVAHCAPLGIHVMVEKPLAVNMDHANKMKNLAEANHILLLTNYETTWYPSNHKIYEMEGDGAIGDVRKIVVHDGHEGPIEIGCSKEFLAWLTDPIMNGGGAVIDFGCYGANLSTWLMENQRPVSVTAVTQQIKPGLYPNVDDEATIILEYPHAQAIIQASWNWTYGRKDIEVYGTKGLLLGPNGTTMTTRIDDKKETTIQLSPLTNPVNEPFAYFASAIRGETNTNGSLSSLENNMIVVEILSAAIQSSKEGKKIFLKK